MVQQLPMSEHERDHVLEHMLLAAARETAAQKGLRETLTQNSVQEALSEIRLLDKAIHFGKDPQQVRAQRRLTAQASKAFLGSVDPWAYPLEYATVALTLHELNSVHGHHSRALYYAKRARFVLSMSQGSSGARDPDRMEMTLTNAVRLEGVSYFNLGLQRAAYVVLSDAERTPAARRHPGKWLPHIFRDKLDCLSHTPRASIAEAEALTLRGGRALEAADVNQAGLQALMLERSLCNVYLHRSRIDDAARLLARLTDEMDTVPDLGLLHRMLILKDYAHVLWHQEDRAQWAEVLGDALMLAEEAGLSHQVALLRQRYQSVPQEAFALLAPTVQELLLPDDRHN